MLTPVNAAGFDYISNLSLPGCRFENLVAELCQDVHIGPSGSDVTQQVAGCRVVVEEGSPKIIDKSFTKAHFIF